jgi:tRNA A-37 threonylcarbamoyl transferase component Bud32
MQTETVAPREFRPGDVVGDKYVIERVIGRGGMGTVVVATDSLLSRRVAIKFLLPVIAEQPAAVRRFLREARATAGLQSEHVVRVIDACASESGAPYIVMEYLEGCDLSELVGAQEPIAVTEAVDLLLQAGEAVAEAHGIGIVHRDLKPSNLFVTTDLDGRRKVKVLDFGISMFIGSSGMSDGRALTGTGDLVGSPLYMSPEQLRDARRVTARTDIWAFGVILYELLTKTSPFQADTMTAICARIVMERPPPLRDRRPDVPKKIEEVILTCLEKDESRRIQTMGELARRLAPFASDDRVARRIEAIAARERRVAVSPSGRPLSAIDTEGPTVAEPGSGWGSGDAPRRRRVRRAIGAAVVIAIAAATVVTALRHRGAASAEQSASVTDDSRALATAPSATALHVAPLHVARAEGESPDHAVDGAADATPAPVASAAATASARIVRASTAASITPRAPVAASMPSASASAPDASAPSVASAHPTIAQAMDSRK